MIRFQTFPLTRIAMGALLLLLGPVAGCVTETVPVREPPPTVQLLEFPTGVLPAGAYHGVTFFFEIDLQRDGPGDSDLRSSDLPDVAEWNEEERDRRGTFYRQLPPIIPRIAPGGREYYSVRDIHHLEYYNSMFQVGDYRYLRMPRARLYVFKKTSKSFTFHFRGQAIVVPATRAWIPSVYYYAESIRLDNGRLLQKDVVQTGLARIETVPEEGYWLVNGKRYIPSGDRPLELPDALHSVGRR